MNTVEEIVEAVERLVPADFLKLRNELERVEEKLFARELQRVSAKHKKGKLTDAKIDNLVLKRRYRDRPA
jgi:hypothetical protein